jgi:hypothetical protein
VFRKQRYEYYCNTKNIILFFFVPRFENPDNFITATLNPLETLVYEATLVSDSEYYCLDFSDETSGQKNTPDISAEGAPYPTYLK